MKSVASVTFSNSLKYSNKVHSKSDLIALSPMTITPMNKYYSLFKHLIEQSKLTISKIYHDLKANISLLYIDFIEFINIDVDPSKLRYSSFFSGIHS